MVPEAAAEDIGVEDLDQLLEAVSQLVRETEWPKSAQGVFLSDSIADAFELSSAIREAFGSGRFTTVTVLFRPLQERSEYLLAAAIDPSFADEYQAYVNERDANGFTGHVTARKMDRAARDIIGHRERQEPQGPFGMEEASEVLYRLNSEIQHRGIGISRAVRELPPESDHGLLHSVFLSVWNLLMCAVAAAWFVKAIDTQAWRDASTLVIAFQQAREKLG